MSTWFNADGLLVSFGGSRNTKNAGKNKADALRVAGAVKQVEVDFDLTLIPNGTVSYTTDRDNNGTADGFNIGDTFLPRS